jgi:hypothetical protein
VIRVDTDALARAVAEQAAKLVLEELRGIVREELQRQRAQERLGSADMAQRGYARTVEAFNRWMQRAARAKAKSKSHSGLRLLAIAHLRDDGRRFWLRSEVEALEAERGDKPALKVVAR